MEKDPYILSSVANALRILDLLNEQPALRAVDISRELKLDKTSVFRLLYTLEKNGYVHKHADARFSLGMKFTYYGAKAAEQSSLVQMAKPYLQMLRDEHNETVHLSVLSNDGRMVFMDKELSSNFINMTSRIGSSKDAYLTAAGKAMLAQLPPTEQTRLAEAYQYQRITERTIGSPQQLLACLATVRADGYATDDGESELGLFCYGAPVFDFSRNCVAAVSLSGPAERMRQHREEKICSLQRTAAAISAAMGYIK